MSRSIHTTRRTVAQLRRETFRDAKLKAELLRQARKDMRRKRRIKAAIHQERAAAPAVISGSGPGLIPIEQFDSGAHVHYALGEADLRSILEALPAPATEGLSRIQLSSGKFYIEEQTEDPEGDRDPFIGRLGSEIIPGVYGGEILGTYAPRSGDIELFAYVYDETAVIGRPLPEKALRAYLRLRALKTLIHEVAHHHDRAVRVGRGRWLADRTATVENYAEAMEHQWTEQIGLGWLQARYPEETDALINWLEEFGGWRLPLAFFAGDSRSTRRDGLQKFAFTTNGAFESLVVKVAALDPLRASPQTWLAFAWEVHFTDDYQLCLQLLERILACQPDLVEAHTLKADTLVHLERFDQALAIALSVLNSHPGCHQAWEVQADVLEARSEWPGLLELCSLWEAVGQIDRRVAAQLLDYRATACCALDRTGELERYLAVRTANFSPEHAQRFRERIFRRAGKHA